MTKILIVSQPLDLHAYAVAVALERKGAKVIYCHTPDFPGKLYKSIRINESGSNWSFIYPDTSESMEMPDVVWWRRPIKEPLLPNIIHPDDEKFAHTENNCFYKGFWYFASKEAFWVNPLSRVYALEYSKPLQQRAVRESSLEIPDTLYTNNPKEIRDFIRSHGGEVIYKPFTPFFKWELGEDGKASIATTLLTEDMLPEDDILAATPGIFQTIVPKAYELRVNVMGEHVFAVKINSQQTKNGKLDWRRGADEIEITLIELPQNIEDACRNILKRLDIVFGCFDIIVTPDGRYVFLEVNQAGQFLWVESMGGAPLLDPFCEFLIQARVDFKWQISEDCIRYSEVKSEAMQRIQEDLEHHIIPESEADRYVSYENTENE